MKRIVLLLLCLTFVAASTATATPVYRYSFDGRTAAGTRTFIPTVPGDSRTQIPYVPDVTSGEYGPTLYSTRAAYPSYARMYFNNDTTGSAGRQTLEYGNSNHTPTYYRTEGTGPLPSSGSFTWELVCRVDHFSGPVTGGRRVGVLFDNTSGDYRLPNYGAPKVPTVLNRLEMRSLSDPDQFQLYFWLGTDNAGRGTNVSTILEFGEYYHIGAVYDDDAKEMSLYIDEVLMDSKSATGYHTRSTNFGLGRRGIDATEWTHGMQTNNSFYDWLSASNAELAPGLFQTTGAQVPEPATMGLVLLASGGLAGYLRRRRTR